MSYGNLTRLERALIGALENGPEDLSERVEELTSELAYSRSRERTASDDSKIRSWDKVIAHPFFSKVVNSAPFRGESVLDVALGLLSESDEEKKKPYAYRDAEGEVWYVTRAPRTSQLTYRGDVHSLNDVQSLHGPMTPLYRGD